MKLMITSSCKRFIFTPFKKIMLHLFKFRLRNGRRLRRPRQRRIAGERRIRRSIFRYLRKAREDDDDDAMELKSFSDTTINQKAPFPSPLTPAYVRNNGREDGRIPDEMDGGDACRRFEKCLAGIVAGEEGRIMAIRDLNMDVEDLVYCWENLRFYRELCKDVFSDNVDPKIELHLKNH
nr:transcription repressor OFP17-like [Ipomoea batatas]